MSMRYLVVPPNLDIQLGVDRIGNYTRAQAEKLLWRHTHPDFKGTWERVKCLLVNDGARGTVMVPLEKLTDEQINERLPLAHKKELARLATKAAA